MDYSTNYFAKSLKNLIYSDIVSFFNSAQQESETIEFKSFTGSATFDKGLDSVMECISGFLNSSGGILVWGAPKGQKVHGTNEKTFQGALTPLNVLKEKDSLISKISSNITPLPIGINVVILEDRGSFVYIFEIQKSTYKPHQFQHSYFVRLDGQTVHAPHYLVQSLMREITYPRLAGMIKFSPISTFGQGQVLPIQIGIFNLSELQNEELVSFRLACSGGYFYQHIFPQTEYKYVNGNEIVFDKYKDVLQYGNQRLHNEHIVINEAELQKTDWNLKLILYFGGKKSPIQTSVYNLKVNLNVRNPNEWLTQIDENLPFTEYLQTLKSSSEDIIKRFTGR